MRPLRTALVALVALSAVTARADEDVLLLRTQESPDVPAACATGENIVLGAFVYAPRSRARDGLVLKEGARPIGTAVGCGTMTSIAEGATAPFRISFDLGDRTVYAAGQCRVAQRFAPLAPQPWPLLLVGCSLAVEAGSDEGLLHGIAGSTSVFLPYPIPGYDTGSYWTLHLYYADAEPDDGHGRRR
jgi:hypothetical protein